MISGRRAEGAALETSLGQGWDGLLPPEWEDEARAAGTALAVPPVRLWVADASATHLFLAASAADALGHATLHPPPCRGVGYLRVAWRAGAAGRALAVQAIARLAVALPERRRAARRVRAWERVEGRAAGLTVTVLTDAPAVGPWREARGLAVALKLVGVRVLGLPAPRVAWADEWRAER